MLCPLTPHADRLPVAKSVKASGKLLKLPIEILSEVSTILCPALRLLWLVDRVRVGCRLPGT